MKARNNNFLSDSIRVGAFKHFSGRVTHTGRCFTLIRQNYAYFDSFHLFFNRPSRHLDHHTFIVYFQSTDICRNKHIRRCAIRTRKTFISRRVAPYSIIFTRSLSILFFSAKFIKISIKWYFVRQFSVLRNYLIMCSQASKINQNLYKSHIRSIRFSFKFSLEKTLILPRTGNIVKCMELQEIWALDFSRFSCVNIQSVSKSETLMVRATLIKMRVSHKLGTVVDHFDMITLWSLVFSTVLAQRNDCCEHLEVRFHQSWHQRFDSYLVLNQGKYH